MNRLTQHTTTTELGTRLAEDLADRAIQAVNDAKEGESYSARAHNYALAAVNTIEATEKVLAGLGFTREDAPQSIRDRLAGAMQAAVWVTGLPEDTLRTNEDGPGFGRNVDEPVTADSI